MAAHHCRDRSRSPRASWSRPCAASSRREVHPGRVGARARGPLSRSDRRADEGARPVRHHDPRGVRRARARPAHLHRRHRGARVRLDVAVGHRQHAHDRRAPDRAPRHRSAEAALAAAPRDRRAARVPLVVGGRRRAATRGTSRAGRRATATSTSSTARSSGSRTASAPDLVALAARTDEGISCFIVEKEPGPTSGGLTVSKNIPKLGYKGIETVEMSYVDHRVPADALLGDPGRGLAYILGALEVGRINIAARAVGVGARRVRRRARVRAATRDVRQADRAAPGDPDEARRHGDEARSGAPADAQRRRAQAGRASGPTSKPAWRSCSRARPRSSSRAESMRIHGGVGYTTELPVERYYRDAPLMIIGEGTNEIQRLVIARGLLARARGGRDVSSSHAWPRVVLCRDRCHRPRRVRRRRRRLRRSPKRTRPRRRRRPRDDEFIAALASVAAATSDDGFARQQQGRRAMRGREGRRRGRIRSAAGGRPRRGMAQEGRLHASHRPDRRRSRRGRRRASSAASTWRASLAAGSSASQAADDDEQHACLNGKLGDGRVARRLYADVLQKGGRPSRSTSRPRRRSSTPICECVAVRLFGRTSFGTARSPKRQRRASTIRSTSRSTACRDAVVARASDYRQLRSTRRASSESTKSRTARQLEPPAPRRGRRVRVAGRARARRRSRRIRSVASAP